MALRILGGCCPPLKVRVLQQESQASSPDSSSTGGNAHLLLPSFLSIQLLGFPEPPPKSGCSIINLNHVALLNRFTYARHKLKNSHSLPVPLAPAASLLRQPLLLQVYMLFFLHK